MQKENQENKFDELAFEYAQLRQEILHNGTLNSQTLATTLAIVGALMGFASSNQITDDRLRGMLFFVTAGIAMIVIIQTSERERTTFMIASYLRAFIEAQLPHLKWETRLNKFREVSQRKKAHLKKPHQKTSHRNNYVGTQQWFYIFIYLCNFALGSIFLLEGTKVNQQYSPWIIAVISISLIASLYFVVKGLKQYNDVVVNQELLFDTVWKEIQSGK